MSALDVSSLVVAQNLPADKSEEEVRKYFSALAGPVLWSSRLGGGDAVVLRLADQESVDLAVSAANKSTWCGKVLKVDPCAQLMGSPASDSKANTENDVTGSPGFKLSCASASIPQTNASPGLEQLDGERSPAGWSASPGPQDRASSSQTSPSSFLDQLPSVATTAQLDSERMALLQNIAQSLSPHTPAASPWASQTAILPVRDALGLETEPAASVLSSPPEPLDPVVCGPALTASHEFIHEAHPTKSARFSSLVGSLSAQSSQEVSQHKLHDQGGGLGGLFGHNMSDDQKMLLANYLTQQVQQGQQQQQQHGGLHMPMQQQQQQQAYMQHMLGGVGSGMGSPAPSGHIPHIISASSAPYNQLDALHSLLPSPPLHSSSSLYSASPSPMRSNLHSMSSGSGINYNTAAEASSALLALAGDMDHLSSESQHSLASLLALQTQTRPPTTPGQQQQYPRSVMQGLSPHTPVSPQSSLDVDAYSLSRSFSVGMPHSGPSYQRNNSNFDPYRSSSMPRGDRPQKDFSRKSMNSRLTSPAHSADWGHMLPSNTGNPSLGLNFGSSQLAPNGSTSSAQQVLSLHVLQEFSNARMMLVQLMLSSFKFLNSDSIKGFYDRLTPVAALYDEMHDLAVVQKRAKCREMAALRQELVKEAAFTQVLAVICSLRYHLHSLSRKLLVLNQGPDSIPIDLLLGSAGPELYHILKTVVPPEVSDFFSNDLPHAKLAVLVFAEFTTVDPSPPAR